ncbi:hypothetical protein H4219_002144 [Mycoemilia scoparia]|uniref:Periplasmic binding protein n=1 Tax=Mycoemilia scoparia TaxID=417184 RepID=A0A9W7ZYE3_9FUNG|nr:hypothetical protein H4219_002144 [Mycoemilia scoparia]
MRYTVSWYALAVVATGLLGISSHPGSNSLAMAQDSSSASSSSDNGSKGQDGRGCISDFDSNKDYFGTKSSVDESNLFEIEYHNSYKVLTTKGAGGAKGNTYVLYMCGAPTPDAAKDADAAFEIPPRDISVSSTSVTAYIEVLGLQDKIKSLGSAVDITSPCLQKMIGENHISSIDATNKTAAASQLESVGIAFSNTPDSKNTVISSEYSDPSILGRVEWVKFFGAFFNAEDKANKVYGQISDNYNCVTDKAQKQYNNLRPVVAWTAYAAPSQYNNNTAYYIISGAEYKYNLTRDSGARMLNATTGMIYSQEEFLDALKEVDVIVDESFEGTTLDDILKSYGVTKDNTDDFPWAKNKRVFRHDGIQNKASGDGFYESAFVFADALLEDLISVSHPEFSKTGYQRRWLRDIGVGEEVRVLGSQDCEGSSKNPRIDMATKCSDLDLQKTPDNSTIYDGVEKDNNNDLVASFDDSGKTLVSVLESKSQGSGSQEGAGSSYHATIFNIASAVTVVAIAACF